MRTSNVGTAETFRDGARMARASALALVIGLAITTGAVAGAYSAADGVTSIVSGRALCSTTPANLRARDYVHYSVASVSEFAAVQPSVHGSVPNPMGKNGSLPPYFGVVVTNPSANSIQVTQIRISSIGTSLFDGNVTPVNPLTGWTVVNDEVVAWSGDLTIPAKSALDFIVRPKADGQDYPDVPISLSAVTDVGTFANSGVHVTTQENGDLQAVSVYFLDGGLPSLAGASTRGGEMPTGTSKRFVVRVEETDDQISIPAGTRLRITLPPGWTVDSLDPLQSTGFNLAAATVTPADACANAQIEVATSTSLRGARAILAFWATAPANLGAVGLFPFDASFENFAVNPHIRTQARYFQEVIPLPRSGNYEGLTTTDLFATVPNPMGDNRAGVWGATFANVSDQPITLTELRFVASTSEEMFKSVIAERPFSGWQRVNDHEIRWRGVQTVPAHRGFDFIALVQGENKDQTDVPITITAKDTAANNYVATATTTTHSVPYAALYYLRGGRPAAYIPAVGNGTRQEFRVAIDEREGRHIDTNAVLSVTIPAGWSNVTAAAWQEDFGQPVYNPGTRVLSVPTTRRIKDRRTVFTYSAEAPIDVLESLYLFSTRLVRNDSDRKDRVNSLCELIVQTTDPSGALEVIHESPPIPTVGINRIDVQLWGSSVGPADLKLDIKNRDTDTWEALTFGTLDAGRSELVGTIEGDLSPYFGTGQRLEARLLSTAQENHILHEDMFTFIASEYRMETSDLAPPTAPTGAQKLPLQQLRFQIDSGFLDIVTLRVKATGNDPSSDLTALRLISDTDCDGIIDAGETDAVPARTLDPLSAEVTFDNVQPPPFPPLPIVRIFSDQPKCLILAANVAATATAGQLVGVEIASGSSMTTNLGPYPVPNLTGYPASSGLVLLTDADADRDGIRDIDELGGGSSTEPLDADTDDDGLTDGEELLLGTDPLNPDTDGDGLFDGTEDGVPPFASLVDSDGDGTPDVVDPVNDDPAITGTDLNVFRPDLDLSTNTDPFDADSDDDGLLDGVEDANFNGRWDGAVAQNALPASGETNPLDPDSDDDGLLDGLEFGLATPQTTDTNLSVFVADQDPTSTTNPLDDDTDDDGLRDGDEDRNGNGLAETTLAVGSNPGFGETDPSAIDTDGDGLQDGTERGVTTPAGIGTDMGVFIPDAQPSSRTNPLDDDTDDDGLADGQEDANRNGHAAFVLANGPTPGSGETDPRLADTDGDGLLDGTERGVTAGAVGTSPAVFIADQDPGTQTDPLDDDSDDDGLLDGSEDLDRNGRHTVVLGGVGTVGSGETDPVSLDTDGDGCADGTESGLSAPQGGGTDPGWFLADEDPLTTTSPLDTDTDDDGIEDGVEDADCNGRVDPGETNPNDSLALLRNDEMIRLNPRADLGAIFTGVGGRLDQFGPDLRADIGEGVDPSQPGSDDDDDLYAGSATSPWLDPDATVLNDAGRPLVLYQLSDDSTLYVVKQAGAVQLEF